MKPLTPFKGSLCISLHYSILVVLGILTSEIRGQTVTPAKVPEPVILAISGQTANFSCESFGNPLSLCIWEKFDSDKSKPSTLISFNEESTNATETSLPGYFLHGDLKTGVCGLYLNNVTQRDMALWQCTLFSKTLVYRENVNVKVVKKPQPPKFAPAELGDLVDGVAVGMNGAALTCYSGQGLPPPTFQFFLGDEPYEGDLYPLNTTTDADGNTYTYQQLRNQRFTWRENGKSLKCVILHEMIGPDDVKETSVYINVKFQPRSEQISKNVYVPELGAAITPISYEFYSNPKPHIYWEVDGVRISAGFSSPDKRIDALLLEEIGPSRWVAKMRIRDMNRKDLKRRYVLKTENDVGRQDFEICLTQSPVREGATCTAAAQGLFLHSTGPKVTTVEDQYDSYFARSELSADTLASPAAMTEKLKQVQHQMQVLKEREALLQSSLSKMGGGQGQGQSKTSRSSRDGRRLEFDRYEKNEDETTSQKNSEPAFEISASSPRHQISRTRTNPRILLASPTQMNIDPKLASHGLEISEVKVESAGIHIRRKPL